MVIFRVVEKIGLHKLIGNGYLQYIATVAMVLGGAIVFSVVLQRLIRLAEKTLTRRKNRLRNNLLIRG